jgi:hypothetical protein
MMTNSGWVVLLAAAATAIAAIAAIGAIGVRAYWLDRNDPPLEVLLAERLPERTALTSDGQCRFRFTTRTQHRDRCRNGTTDRVMYKQVDLAEVTWLRINALPPPGIFFFLDEELEAPGSRAFARQASIDYERIARGGPVPDRPDPALEVLERAGVYSSRGFMVCGYEMTNLSDTLSEIVLLEPGGDLGRLRALGRRLEQRREFCREDD